ncbi:MAG: WecB/TagA/CpsF family glycosyltransferase [Planctomycetota bacterium]
MIQSQTQYDLPDPVNICGLPVRPLEQEQLIHTLIERAKYNIRTCVHYLNAHTFNISMENPDFHKILATSDLLYADGISVVWAGRWLGHHIPERLTAADYFEYFCRQCAKEDVSLYLLGGLDGISKSTADILTSRIPSLHIKGTHHGYFGLEESQRLIGRINSSGADVLAVGMGSPHQETWVAENANNIKAPVVWTVGALFDYFTQREPRAPQWLCRYGGEWLYRLIHNPAEKWKRYLVGNFRFVWRIMQEGASAPKRG